MLEADIAKLADAAREKYRPNQREDENPEKYCYPEMIERVTYGTANCELLLWFGEKYTAMVDAGMCYPAPKIIANIEEALKKRSRDSLDIIMLSHSHYDHVGALPYIIKRWPNVKVYASEKCSSVFESENARALMKALGENARESYYNGLWKDTEIITDPMRVDVIVKEGDRIYIGKDQYFEVLETKGHTDCSLSFGYEPLHILFASESTGVYANKGFIHTAILKSNKDAIVSAEKCEAYAPNRIISPHYGLVPEAVTKDYFNLFRKSVREEEEMVLEFREKAADFEEVLEFFTKVYWTKDREEEQPIGAFKANAKPIIKTILRDSGRDF